MKADAASVLTGIEDLELEEGELIEATVVIVKTVRPDGKSYLRHAATEGISPWEMLGMTQDTLDQMRFEDRMDE